MEIIIVEKTAGKGGYQARVHGKSPYYQTFAENEVDALRQLAEKILEKNSRAGLIGKDLYKIKSPPPNNK